MKTDGLKSSHALWMVCSPEKQEHPSRGNYTLVFPVAFAPCYSFWQTTWALTMSSLLWALGGKGAAFTKTGQREETTRPFTRCPNSPHSSSEPASFPSKQGSGEEPPLLTSRRLTHREPEDHIPKGVALVEPSSGDSQPTNLFEICIWAALSYASLSVKQSYWCPVGLLCEYLEQSFCLW